MPSPPPPEPPPQPPTSSARRETTTLAIPARDPLLDANDTNKTSPILVLPQLTLYVPDFMPHLMTVLRSIHVNPAFSAIPMSAVAPSPATPPGIRKKERASLMKYPKPPPPP